MATIPSTTNQMRHVRKTITFTGGANLGLLGDTVPCFALTGRVMVAYWTIFCSDSLVCTAPLATALGMGTATWSESLTTAAALSGAGEDATTGTWLTRNDGWYPAGVSQPLVAATNPGAFTPLSLSIVLAVNNLTGGANITGGSVIVDLWYYPITDDGALAGDDIDAGYTPADVKAWLGTAAATPTVAGVPEVDVTHVSGTAQTAGDLKASLNTIDDFLDTEIASILAAVDTEIGTLVGYGAPPTAAAIADAVLNEDMTAHQTQGTLGQAIGDPAADANTIYGAVVTGATGATIAADIITIDDLLDSEIGALTTAVADIPTNAELATALGTADDAVLAILGTPAGASLAADIAAIEAQTDDIGIAGAGLTAIPWNAAWDAEVQSEATDALNAYDPPTNAEMITALGTADDAVLAAITALNNLSAAQVNAEVVDALATDTYAEPTGVPTSAATLATKLGYLYMTLRNKVTVTTTKKIFYDDALAALWEKDLADDGTTYTESEGNAP